MGFTLEPVQLLPHSAIPNSLVALLQAHDQDAERLYRKLKARQERVGIEQPSVEVRFEDLKVEAKVYVGNRAVPTVINSYRNFVEVGRRDPACRAAACMIGGGQGAALKHHLEHGSAVELVLTVL